MSGNGSKAPNIVMSVARIADVEVGVRTLDGAAVRCQHHAEFGSTAWTPIKDDSPDVLDQALLWIARHWKREAQLRQAVILTGQARNAFRQMIERRGGVISREAQAEGAKLQEVIARAERGVLELARRLVVEEA